MAAHKSETRLYELGNHHALRVIAPTIRDHFLRAMEVGSRVRSATEKEREMKKYTCNICGYVYDPAVGDPENGVKPGTPFEKLPDSWTCPVCGAAKSDFSPEE